MPKRSATPGRYQTCPDVSQSVVSTSGLGGGGGSRTGSTANLVTASSPELLRQTLPSGTLYKVHVLDRKHSRARAVPHLTVYLSSHSLRVQAATVVGGMLAGWLSFQDHASLQAGRSLAFMCALVIAMVGRMSTSQGVSQVFSSGFLVNLSI